MTTSVEKFDPKERKYLKTEWIPVKNLSIVWVDSQRPLNEAHAQHIADNFDPDMFGVLAVTKPNGKGVYHVIDGQHRRVAIEKLWGENEQVPCQVYDAEDPARAAELFDFINSHRRAPRPIEIFRVRVTAKNELQVAVDKIVRNCGYSVGYRSPGSICCVSSLEAIYQRYGGAILTATITMIDGIWGKDVNAFEASIVRGMGLFLSSHRGIDIHHLRQCVAAKYTPARLLGAAKTAREIHGGSAAEAVRDLLLTTYNATMKTKKKKLVTEQAE